ncbi:sigma-70 family RNA polymerase sigma factor [Reichenbachiella sp. MALMAid0571]|uniref:RNA polymerase sigma factor n=1 Tax=Reichenbachiella sp. MALMAid0571 TaxID=3143939 RepID=UPI0032DFBE3C
MDKSVCEEQVFNDVHSSHVVTLRNFLYYKLGDLEKAKDYTQEAFVRLWDNCSKVSLDKVKSYLFTIANRLFLDDTDHQKVALKFQIRSGVSESQQENNPEFLYRQEEFKIRLEEAVSNLPEKQRVVFLMSRIDKIKNKEIAKELNLSIKTVEKHISNSLKTLKANLDELNGLKI